jgi:hypothetical protein
MPRIATRERSVNDERHDEPLQRALAENLITLMGLSNEHGKVVAQLVQPHQFDNEVLRTIATRAANYWHTHNQAPGVAHIADLVDDIISDPENRKGPIYRAALTNMIALWDSGLNPDYVLDEIQTFLRMQSFKRTLLKSADVLSEKQELAIGEVEDMWRELLRDQPRLTEQFGLRLGDLGGVVSYLQQRNSREFSTGIPELDRAYVVPARGTLMVTLAKVGAGKSWWLVHLGRQALMQGQRVLHVTLELSEEELRLRYLQNLSALARYPADAVSEVTTLMVEDGRLIGFGRGRNRAEFVLDRNDGDDSQLRAQLVQRHGFKIGALNRIRLKYYPSRSLSIARLHGDLDYLQEVERFVPDLVLVDYLGLAKTNTEQHRLELGQWVEGLRALAIERQVAVAAAQQVNRSAQDANIIGSGHIAEDFSIVATADIMLMLNRTAVETQHQLARLWVGKARNARDGFGVVLSQNYQHGQFHLNSAPLEPGYEELLKRLPTAEQPMRQSRRRSRGNG